MQSIQEKDLKALHDRIKALERQVEQPVAPSDDTLRDLASELQGQVAEMGREIAELKATIAEQVTAMTEETQSTSWNLGPPQGGE